MTVCGASLDESDSNLSKIAATSLLLGVTRTSSEAYTDAVAVLLRFPELVPDLKPTSVTDPVNKKKASDRVAPV